MKTGLFFKILILGLSLGAVFYLIETLDSGRLNTKAGDPNSFIGLMLGGDQRLLNWCPADVEKVEIFHGDNLEVAKVLTSPQDLSAVCELMIGGFSEGSQPPSFKIKLRAYPKGSGNPVSLEKADGAPLFRVKGMPFSCPGLEKVLGRLENP